MQFYISMKYGIMAQNRSFSRRTVLRASTGTVGGLLAVGTASADESDGSSEDEVICLDCFAPYNIDEIQIDKAIPPSVTGSVTVTYPCSGTEARVQIFVNDMFVREERVYINCREEATVDFEYSPDQPLKPGTHELRVTVLMEGENITTEETIEFQVPSGRGRDRGKGRSKGKGR